MKIDQATKLIRDTLEKMRRVFSRSVFDEWVLFRLEHTRPEILLYEGPREKAFAAAFRRDTTLLMQELRREHYAPGHFYFARDAAGELYDAFLVVGPDLYVVFNNTAATMNDITANPLWADAQVHFVELSECFAAAPAH